MRCADYKCSSNVVARLMPSVKSDLVGMREWERYKAVYSDRYGLGRVCKV